MAEDEFVPKPGHIRQTRTKPARRFTKQMMARVERAGGSRRLKNKSSTFTGGRTGRGLGARPMHGFRGLDRRRVIVKVRLAVFGKGAARFTSFAGARAHLSYIQREAAVLQEHDHAEAGKLERDFGADDPDGHFYSAEHDHLDGLSFLDQSKDDRHQFRIIVSPEDGTELASLKDYTRDLMRGVEQDLDTRLDWIAVDHFNTGHPHTHIVLRGKDDREKDLVIARDYIRHGFRKRAELNLTRELGPRQARDIAASLNQEIDRERFTSLDRDLLSLAVDGEVHLLKPATLYDRFRTHLRLGRLKTLEGMGLARNADNISWRLRPDLKETLVRMGERGDIIRTMQRAHKAEVERQVFDPANSAQRPVLGEIVATGLRDDRESHKYLIVSGTDGRHWYAELDLDEALPGKGGIVSLTPSRGKTKPSDRTIDRIAKKHRGVYSRDLHIASDGPQSDTFLTAHKRRLEGLRRKGLVERQADGSWHIPDDYLTRVAAADGGGVSVDVHSSMPVKDQIRARSHVWLDQRIDDAGVGATGFGNSLTEALAKRRQFLLAQGLARSSQGQFVIDKVQLDALARQSLDEAGGKLAKTLGKQYRAFVRQVSGTYLRPVDLPSGRYAVIDSGRHITLVHWSRVIENYRGRQVEARLSGKSVSWHFGRSIPLPPR